MPVREVVTKPKNFSYTYESLVEYIRSVIIERYGSLAAFVESNDFESVGFDNARTIKTNIYVYLSKGSKTKSLPVLSKLYKYLLDIELVGKVKVIRELIITSSREI